MAQFLIVAYEAAYDERVERWLRVNAAPDEQTVRRRIGGRRLLLLTPDPATEVYRGGYFRGTAVSPDGECIAFGAEAWRSVARRFSSDDGPDGMHVRAAWGRRQLTLARDGFGSIALMHTEAPGLFAASDSLLVLADLRRELGLPVSVDREVALARSRTLALTLQAMSTATLVSQISFTPAGQSITVTFNPEWEVRRSGRTVVERAFAPGPDWSYPDAIRRAAGIMTGTLAAITEVATAALQLSGGEDSRAVLAAARRTGAHSHLRMDIIDRTPDNATDAAVALDLLGHLGLRHRAAPDAAEGLPLDGTALAIWASSHLGVYDRIVPDKPETFPPTAVLLTGLGGEVAKGNYHWSSRDGIRARYLADGADRSKFAEERGEALLAQFTSGVKAIGADPTWADASEWHYLAYRNGLHGGATSPVEMSGLRPLQQWDLATAGHQPDSLANEAPIHRMDATFHRSAGIVTDLLAVIDYDLATFPYAGIARSNGEQMRIRMEDLGGPLADAEIVRPVIVGRPSDIKAGPFAASVRIAERWGYGIGSDADSIDALATELVDGIPDDALRGIHRELLDLTRNELRKPGRIAMDAGSGPPKVLSAALLSL